jgi:catechol 2,3-dioxygenase-like lactoylglutathione lyase family enzyme
MHDQGLQVTGTLHCNLNVASLAAAVPVYEALGLTVKMRSRALDQDSTALGIPRTTASDAWFLYDHRGGRGGPAVELVEWVDPVTAGSAYADPTHVGMWGLGFEVADPAAVGASLLAAGASPCEERPASTAASVTDADGVALELVAGDGPSATLRHVRMTCTSIDATARWYEQLGFEVDDERTSPWTRPGGEVVDVCERPVTLAGPPGLTLRLTQWPAPASSRAHGEANHRGLFRMAFAVPDAAAAVAAAREAAVEASDATWIPLPGTPLGGVWVSFLVDPDGVMVELVERTLT